MRDPRRTFLYKRFLWIHNFHLKLLLNMIFTYNPLNTFDTLLLKSYQKKRKTQGACHRATWPWIHNHSIHRAQELLHIIFYLLDRTEEYDTTLVKLEGWNISQVCCIFWLWGNNVMFDNKRLMMKNTPRNHSLHQLLLSVKKHVSVFLWTF